MQTNPWFQAEAERGRRGEWSSSLLLENLADKDGCWYAVTSLSWNSSMEAVPCSSWSFFAKHCCKKTQFVYLAVRINRLAKGFLEEEKWVFPYSALQYRAISNAMSNFHAKEKIELLSSTMLYWMPNLAHALEFQFFQNSGVRNVDEIYVMTLSCQRTSRG